MRLENALIADGKIEELYAIHYRTEQTLNELSKSVEELKQENKELKELVNPTQK